MTNQKAWRADVRRRITTLVSDVRQRGKQIEEMALFQDTEDYKQACQLKRKYDNLANILEASTSTLDVIEEAEQASQS